MTPSRGGLGSFLIGVMLGCATLLTVLFGLLAMLGGGKK